MNEALVVIDMQPTFLSYFAPRRARRIVAAVAKEIKIARAKSQAIISLTMDGKGQIHDEIRNSLKGYPFLTASKANNGGGTEVYIACEADGICPDAFFICGINTEACVYETVKGLMNIYDRSTVTIIERACDSGNTWRDNPHAYGLNLLKEINQLRFTKLRSNGGYPSIQA